MGVRGKSSIQRERAPFIVPTDVKAYSLNERNKIAVTFKLEIKKVILYKRKQKVIKSKQKIV